MSDKAKASREVLNRMRAKTFNALQQLFKPGENLKALFEFLAEHVSLNAKQLTCVRSGQQHLPESDGPKLRELVEQKAAKHQGDEIIGGLIADIDISLLHSPIGGDPQVEQNYRKAVEERLRSSIGTIAEEPAKQDVSAPTPSANRLPSFVTGVEDGKAKLVACPPGTSGAINFSPTGVPLNIEIEINAAEESEF